MIPSPVKQTKNTQQQIKSHLKKIDVSRFPVVSNEATQELNSVAVNKQSKYALLHKTVNERTVLPSWCQCRHLENILKQMAPQELDKVPNTESYAEVTKTKGDDNELDSLKLMPLNGI